MNSLIEDLRASKLRYEIWVADSASTDQSANIVRRDFPAVNLIESRENIGFGAANNLALRRQGFEDSARQRELPEAVYLLNPDTVTHPGATRRLYDELMSREMQAWSARA